MLSFTLSKLRIKLHLDIAKPIYNAWGMTSYEIGTYWRKIGFDTIVQHFVLLPMGQRGSLRAVTTFPSKLIILYDIWSHPLKFFRASDCVSPALIICVPQPHLCWGEIDMFVLVLWPILWIVRTTTILLTRAAF